MSKITKISPMTQGRVIGKLLIPSLAVAAAFAVLPISARAAEVDLTVVGDTPQPVAADFGGNGLVANFHTHPSGTGVFDPFLTLERNAAGGVSSGIESAYNTDGHSGLYLDQQRPEWNTYLKLSDLAVVDVSGAKYYAFELDANEPGNTKSLISVDNIRIYTSASDNTGLVQNNEGNLDKLGTLRWAMNNPLTPAGTTQNPGNYNIDKWIKLDANLSDVLSKANGGSGFSDLIMYIPIGAFKDAGANDLVWFYNLNGVHYVADGDLAAQAGYEEWRAVKGVPEGGNTLALLGSALSVVGLVAGRRKMALAKA